MKSCNILISCYNEKPEWLLTCIGSLSAQNIPDNYTVKIIIGVDNCEQTKELFRENKIPFYYPEKNIGLFAMVDSMIAVNPADIYLLFDADDIAYPEYIMTMIKMVEEHGFFKAPFDVGDSELNTIKPHRKLAGRIGVRADIYKKLGGFYHYRSYCDTDFSNRAKAFINLDNIKTAESRLPALYIRRLHETSNTAITDYMVGGKYYNEIKTKLRTRLRRKVYRIKPEITVLKREAVNENCYLLLQ